MTVLEIMEEVKKGKRPEFGKENVNPAIKDLIERCWDQDPKKRSSFADIITEIKENSEYIQNCDESQELFDYIDHIETQKDLNYSLDQIKLYDNDNTEVAQDDDDADSPNLNNLLCPKEIFDKLSQANQNTILKAEKSDSVQFKVAQNFLAGTSKFPKNREIGLTYMFKSILNGNEEALNNYVKKYMEGKKGIKAARKFIEDHNDDEENPIFDYINGFAYMKEKNFNAAIQSFMKSAEKGSQKAAKKLGEIYRDGIGTDPNPTESTRYYTMASKMKKKSTNKFEETKSLFLNGLRCLQDYQEEKIQDALKFFEESAKKGYLQSIKEAHTNLFLRFSFN